MPRNTLTERGFPFGNMKKPKGHEGMVKGGGDTTCHGAVLFCFLLVSFFFPFRVNVNIIVVYSYWFSLNPGLDLPNEVQ